jgi:23S rRNA (pseudouridine1915-N3)-methyltransferase
LYIQSKQLSTEDFQKFIEDTQMKYSDIVFITGGAYGVNYENIKGHIDDTLSFSPMTFPHSGALMMLLEQIYRAQCIKKGIKYHH